MTTNTATHTETHPLVRTLTFEYVLVNGGLVCSLMVTESAGTAIPASGQIALTTALGMLQNMQGAIDGGLVKIVELVSDCVSYTKPPADQQRAN